MKARKIKRFTRDEQLKILTEIGRGHITMKGAAEKYQVPPSTICYWKIHFGMRPPHGKVEKARMQSGQPAAIKSKAERVLESEVEELKLKLAELFIENDFLKKAQIFVERQKKLDTSIVTDLNQSQFVKRAR